MPGGDGDGNLSAPSRWSRGALAAGAMLCTVIVVLVVLARFTAWEVSCGPWDTPSACPAAAAWLAPVGLGVAQAIAGAIGVVRRSAAVTGLSFAVLLALALAIPLV